MHARWGSPLRELVAPMISEDAYPRFVEGLMELLSSTPPSACAGAAEFLQSARSRGLPVVIVTSNESALAGRDLQTLGLAGLVDAVFGSDVTAFHKPDPRVFDEAAALLSSKWGVDIGDCIYVGDSLTDHASAQGLCAFGAVTSGATTRTQFLEADVPDHWVHDSLHSLSQNLYR
ncbi:hypothetical protein ATY41_05820 [Leifsonia xyli subsp. xyli]|nr:HAD-IA family hydrolase [Leifsonia xyli]ODA89424.1 hypothetical protein ATY41_05820 [Leifsonia xyli subsp. xyli]